MVEVKPETMPGVAEGAVPAVADGAKPAVHNDFNAKNPASSPFAEGERCLIPNENILYEGKVGDASIDAAERCDGRYERWLTSTCDVDRRSYGLISRRMRAGGGISYTTW